jgi:hypothetical protein
LLEDLNDWIELEIDQRTGKKVTAIKIEPTPFASSGEPTPAAPTIGSVPLAPTPRAAASGTAAPAAAPKKP